MTTPFPEYDWQASRDEAHRFITTIIPRDFECSKGFDLLISSAERGKGFFAPHWQGSHDQFADTVADLSMQRRVYMQIGMHSKAMVQTRSHSAVGYESEVVAVPGIAFDLDFQAEGHAPDNNLSYPPDEDAVRELVAAMPIVPSIIIRTWGGLQPWYLYDELHSIDSPEDRTRLKAAQVALFLTIRAHAHARGWFIDAGNVSLNKQLRIPGGYRLKGQDTRRVIGEYHPAVPRYSLSTIEEAADPGALITAETCILRSNEIAKPLATGDEAAAALRELAQHALDQIDRYAPKAVDNRDFWIRVGFAIRNIGGSDAENFELYRRWSSRSFKYDADDTVRVWNSFRPQRATIHGIVAKAVALSPRKVIEALQPEQAGAGTASVSETGDAAADLQEPVPLGQYDPKTGRIVLSPSITLPTSEAWLRQNHTVDGVSTLIYLQGRFRNWTSEARCHTEIECGELKQRLFPWLNKALKRVQRNDGSFEYVDFPANPTTVDAALQTIQQNVFIPSTVTPPCFIHGTAPVELPDSRYLVVARNGVFNLAGPDPYKPICEPTPRLLVTHAIDFDLIKDCVQPVVWLEFLNKLWPDDPQSIQLLQEWFGLCLVGYTGYQKILGLFGPPRSGKGTICRAQTKLIGTRGVAGLTFSTLASQFGLSGLVGKMVAIISDARLSGRTDVMTVVERLLSISGEDLLPIERKYLEAVSVRLMIRLMVVSNEMPRFIDASGALGSRFLFLQLSTSFLGSEDTTLDDRIAAEMPSIFTWAVEGFLSLHKRGRLEQPRSGEALRDELCELASPITYFLGDYTDESDPHAHVAVPELFLAWCAWCREHGKDRPGDEQTFGRNLRAARPGLKLRQVRQGGKRVRAYDGIRLTHAGESVARLERVRRSRPGGGADAA